MAPSPVPRPGPYEVIRSGLLGQLAAALDVPLIILAAPSGYGKTTLLAQYARSTPRQVVWCQLQDGPVTPLDVTDHLTQSLSGWLKIPETLLNPDPRTPDETLARQLAQVINTADHSLDLIIDHAHEEGVARWLLLFAGLLGEGHRVLLSRYDTSGLPLARRVVENQVMILSAAELQFSPVETRALLDSRQARLAPQLIIQLQGWPAGLALASRQTHTLVSPQDLVREALAGLPADHQAILPGLATLDVWSEAAAEQLGLALPAGLLSTLVWQGLPLTPLGNGQYQPHQLLRAVLLEDLSQGGTRWQPLLRRAADQARAQGDARRAMQLFLRSGDLERATELAEVVADRYRQRGEHLFTRQALESFGIDQLPRHLQARLAWAWAETGESHQAEHLLLRLHDQGELPPAGYASLAMLRGRQGDILSQFKFSEIGLRITGEPDDALPALSWPYAQAALRLGQPALAQQAATRFMAWAHQRNDQTRLAEAWQLQALVARQTGQLSAAQAALRQARQVYELLGWTARAAAIRLDETEITLRLGQVDDVRGALHQLQGLLQDAPAVLQQKYWNLTCRLRLHDCDLHGAQDALTSAKHQAQQGGIHPELVGLHLLEADLRLQQGDWEAARTLLTGLPVNTDPHQQRYTQVLQAHLPGVAPTFTLAELEHWTDALHCARATQLLGHQAPPASSPTRVNPASQPLHITALGDLTVQHAGQTIPISLSKSRELLVWLVLQGSGNRDELVTALWNGSAEERHLEYLRVAIRKLRAALRCTVPEGLDPLPYQEGRYRLSSQLPTRIDAQPYQALPSDLQELEQAFRQYSRPFMPSVDSEWVIEMRALCQQRAVDLGLALAKAQQHHAPLAITTYRRVLQLDPGCDAAHQQLILTLLDGGHRAEAESSYRHYQVTLQEEFNASIDPEFTRRYQDLLSKQT